MKKFVSIFLAFLILYNILGYIIVFKSCQYTIRNEIKRKITNSLPENELVVIKLTASDFLKSRNGYKKTDKNEFRLNGKLYDIVRTKVCGDTTIAYCINDSKEEDLFSNLDTHVKRYLDQNIPLREKSNDLFKVIVKQALLHSYTLTLPDVSTLSYSITNATLPEYCIKNIPSPPPKNLL